MRVFLQHFLIIHKVSIHEQIKEIRAVKFDDSDGGASGGISFVLCFACLRFALRRSLPESRPLKSLHRGDFFTRLQIPTSYVSGGISFRLRLLALRAALLAARKPAAKIAPPGRFLYAASNPYILREWRDFFQASLRLLALRATPLAARKPAAKIAPPGRFLYAASNPFHY